MNPVVGECNDCRINHIQKRAIGEKEVREAFAAASEEFGRR
ncbi:MAG: P1 family peptidase [Coprococcus sp.]